MTKKSEKLVRVRGTKPTYIGQYRDAGEEFNVPEHLVSKRSMQVLDKPKSRAKPEAKGEEPKEEPKEGQKQEAPKGEGPATGDKQVI